MGLANIFQVPIIQKLVFDSIEILLIRVHTGTTHREEHSVAEIMGCIREDTACSYLFDIDDTLYTNPHYRKEGARRELCEIATKLGVDYATVQERVNAKRSEIKDAADREPTLTETVYALGITREQWNELRCRVWQPCEWIAPDPELYTKICWLVRKNSECQIAFGTNSPVAVGRETLRALGIPDIFRVFGPESFGVSKPDQMFFLKIAASFETNADAWISIGDRKMSDAEPALAAGFCAAVIVQGRDDLVEFLNHLLINPGDIYNGTKRQYNLTAQHRHPPSDTGQN